MAAEGEDILLVTSGGIIMRTKVEEISCLSRTTQGVRVVRLGDNIKVIDMAGAQREEEAEEADDQQPAEE